MFRLAFCYPHCYGIRSLKAYDSLYCIASAVLISFQQTICLAVPYALKEDASIRQVSSIRLTARLNKSHIVTVRVYGVYQNFK